LDELVDDLKMFPQTLLNVRCAEKHSISKHPLVQAAVLEAQTRLGKRGRINLRPSGTEPLVRVMVEGENEAEILEIARSVGNVIETVSSAAV
jgi:phosphoglucosamine mutase